MTPIYTKKGDAGETGLADNRRIRKTDLRINAVGTVDELNSALGLARSFLAPQSVLAEPLATVQHELFIIGSRLALPSDAADEYKNRLPELSQGLIDHLEAQIDLWWGKLPELKNFILPGGSPAASAVHLARAISRRAERAVLSLNEAGGNVDPLLIKFLNRLSDFLFAAARFANYEFGVADTLWNKDRS